MTQAKQDDLSRQRRLNAGRCPTHGLKLVQQELTKEGLPVVACPRADCDFLKAVEPHTKLAQLLRVRRIR